MIIYINILIITITFCYSFQTVNLCVICAGNEVNTECSGKVVLSSDYHDFPFEIQAEDLKQKRGNRKKIKYRRNGRLLHFDYVEMTGNCRWSVWSKSRSGESFQVDQPGIQEPGWPIRAVKLLI